MLKVEVPKKAISYANTFPHVKEILFFGSAGTCVDDPYACVVEYTLLRR